MNTYAKMVGGWLVGLSNPLLVLSSDKAAFREKSTHRGETSTNRMSFRRFSESSFSRPNESSRRFFSA